MQLTAAAVTPPAEHAGRRPAWAADAAVADAGVRQQSRIIDGIDLMRKWNCIALGFTLLISWLLFDDDCHSETTEVTVCHLENADMVVVDTLYARVAVGISNERPCSGLCAICDVIAKYRVPLYASELGEIIMRLQEARGTCFHCIDYIGNHPPDYQYQDSVRCEFPLETRGFEQAHVQIRLGGSYYKVAGEGDTMRYEYIGDIVYCDTVVVRTQRIQRAEMIFISRILLGIAMVSALFGVTSAFMIAGALQKSGIKVNWVWLRLLILSKYLGQYRDITRQETGRTGTLFYSYVIGMNLALVTVIAGLVLRAF